MAQDDGRKTHTVRIATYNIHRARGLDGRTRLERIAAVLATIDADVVALQEVVGASPLKPGQAAELGAALGMGWVMAPTCEPRCSATWSSAATPSASTTITT
jgi:hypothetical protein